MDFTPTSLLGSPSWEQSHKSHFIFSWGHLTWSMTFGMVHDIQNGPCHSKWPMMFKVVHAIQNSPWCSKWSMTDMLVLHSAINPSAQSVDKRHSWQNPIFCPAEHVTCVADCAACTHLTTNTFNKLGWSYLTSVCIHAHCLFHCLTSSWLRRAVPRRCCLDS